MTFMSFHRSMITRKYLFCIMDIINMITNQSSSLRSSIYIISILGVLIVRTIILFDGVVAQQQEQQYASSSLLLASTWQSCSTFLTPSIDGWAVFAGRDFQAQELVELTPFFIPLESHRTKHSVLDDYVFSFPTRKASTTDSDRDSEYNVVLLGNGAFYNHHQNPNLQYVQIVQRSEEKNDGNNHNNNTNVSTIPHLVGFRATRKIFAGDQLYVSYGDYNYNTNNMDWFEARSGLQERTMTTEESIDSYMLPFYLSKHCSRIYSGIGLPTWRDTILPILSSKNTAQRMGNTNDNHHNDNKSGAGMLLEHPTNWIDRSRLAPFDAGLSDARAKVDVKQGDRLETSLGLILSRNAIRNTALGPIAFYWENLKIDHHQYLINLRDDEKLILQYQGTDTDWESVDRFIAYSEITIVPLSGNIGLVRRVGQHENEAYNCKLMIRSNKDHEANKKIGVTLELIATRDIPAGDVLKLNIAPSEFEEEYRLLHDEMEQSGQPHHPASIFDSILHDDEEAEEL